jgi:hypothetical protein
MPNEKSVENRAIVAVTTYLEAQGYVVENVSKNKKGNPKYHGLDLVARKPGEEITIEVKGTTKEWGIPDPYGTEFHTETLALIADFLYVAYLPIDGPSYLYVIPREAIKPEHLEKKTGYRIKKRFKNQKTLEPYRRPLPYSPPATE